MGQINITPKNNPSKSATERAKFIANEIFRQMKCPNFWVFGSWGGSLFTFGINEENEPYLRFKVNGAKFKGLVFVVYDFSDTYKIAFVDKKQKVTHEVSEVYADQLQEVIDNYVEKIPEYKF